MIENLKRAFEHRRSYYALEAKSLISDEEIEDILKFVVEHTPSPFNSQSTRIVLLLGDRHKRLWEIVLEELGKVVDANTLDSITAKVNASFASGYGTVLFFEDQNVVKSLIEKFPAYSDRFPVWSQHTAAMHQLLSWTMLEAAGFGASLQHYNPVIDKAVAAEFDLPQSWALTAQMPFGLPTAEPGAKDFSSISDRFKVFK